MSLYTPRTATENLKGPGALPEFKLPDVSQEAVLFHPKSYRIHLRSQDRLNATDDANIARFNLRDLATQWGVRHRNLDAGNQLWRMRVASFVLSAPFATDVPFQVSLHAKGFPHQTESWSSQSEGPTDLLAVLSAAGSLAYVENSDAITLHAIPSGIVEIQVRCLPDTLDSVGTLMWELVLNIESAKHPGTAALQN